MRSPLYSSGLLFRAAMHLLHGPGLNRKYAHICSFISPGDRVLDLGCGTGTLQSHLKGNYYLGLEMNDSFVAYAKKKGRNVVKQDVLRFRRFNDFDVCVMMDVLHHLNPRHAELVEKALAGVRKTVIISEPFDAPNKNGALRKIGCILDDDGINASHTWMDKKALVHFYEEYSPERIDEISSSMIAVYRTGGSHKHKTAISRLPAGNRARKSVKNVK